MAIITIEDLEQDADLDMQAMKAIFGGRRHAGSVLGARSMKFASRARFQESSLIPELIKVDDLRKLD